jgi:para-nitrobenzyl esterase
VWDVLDAEGVTAVCGDHPPHALADEMHAAWVRFIATGNPGWGEWTGHNAYVFGGEQTDTYAPTRLLAAGLQDPRDHPS